MDYLFGLHQSKADAGIVAVEASETEAETENPFMEIERGFKEIYNAYKKERAEHNRQIERKERIILPSRKLS